jgi:3-oxoacyl-[acyl-carrier protein] reductase
MDVTSLPSDTPGDSPVLVTGGTGGLGRSVCKMLLDNGVKLLLAGRNLTDPAKRSPQDAWISACERIHLDFSDDNSVATFGDRLASVAPRLAGVCLIYPRVPKTSSEQPLALQDWREAIDLSFLRPMACLDAACQAVRDRGKVVVVSGVTNVQVFPEHPMANVIRLSWLAHVKGLSYSLGARHVCVNTVSFGGVLTDRFRASLEQRTDPTRYYDRLENIPLGEYGTPEQAALVISTMLTGFADHITGANIICDGGLTRRY